MHRVISMSVVIVVLIIVVIYAYEYYSPLAFRAKLPQGRRKTVTSVRVLATFRDKFFLYYPPLLKFSNTSKTLYIYTYHVGAGSGKIKIHPLEGHVQCPADVGGVQGTFESFRLAKRDEL